MANKFLVIGSNSFSGASFTAHCLRKGFDVLGISRSPEPNRAFLPYQWLGDLEKGRFQFFQGDLNKNRSEIIEEIQNYGASHIVNFASQGMVAESWEAPIDWYETNTVSQIALHDELRKWGKVMKYVHISTPEVYGNTEGLISESDIYRPSTPYATSRAACDMSLMNFRHNYGFPVVFTRAANVFGPGQQLYRIIPRTILGILSGKKLQLHGGGSSVRSFIHIDDVAEATLQVAEDAGAGEIFHLSTDRSVSICELVKLICGRMNASFEENVEIALERDGKDHAYLLDSSRAKHEFGWEPQIGLEEGVDQTIEWVESHWDTLKNEPIQYIHKK